MINHQWFWAMFAYVDGVFYFYRNIFPFIDIFALFTRDLNTRLMKNIFEILTKNNVGLWGLALMMAHCNISNINIIYEIDSIFFFSYIILYKNEFYIIFLKQKCAISVSFVYVYIIIIITTRIPKQFLVVLYALD